jgi:hypothetical protein
MRFARAVLVSLLLLLGIPIYAQEGPQAQAPPTAQGAIVLGQVFATLIGSTTVSDVTLTGTARHIAGSEDEMGTVTLQALATGESSVASMYASGNLSEVVSLSSAGMPVGNWSSPDGVSHPISQHNLWTDSSWFFPALTVSKLFSRLQSYSVTLVSQETKNGVSVRHLTTTGQFSNLPPDLTAQMQHLSQMELFVDLATLLPVALDFNIHPDNNMLLDIPVEIRFSDYRAVSGIQVPFHVEKYFNGSLNLDIQLQTATVNSGISANTFAIQ